MFIYPSWRWQHYQRILIKNDLLFWQSESNLESRESFLCNRFNKNSEQKLGGDIWSSKNSLISINWYKWSPFQTSIYYRLNLFYISPTILIKEAVISYQYFIKQFFKKFKCSIFLVTYNVLTIVPLLFPTLFGKRGIFTRSPWLWVLCPLSL